VPPRRYARLVAFFDREWFDREWFDREWFDRQ
jgi:hypothetical protein